ncbi:CinA family nicotinamide mononucleotide deamidase-related protein [Chryseobacterium sp.]|uniref:CinA family nicotinamide mononucleotide deamidase-related protein n=1 Tax=Chryseobacterium sp. TaxID=1871047 RepID=UPI0011C7B86B|nr:CinA family nicotinamide mononucleotide deamidase-related protein [Chryseobacterium sp.]TXF77586.1 CinA family nicotinamide mononucleotide deamidase-related protein [Chryseobacterium sp.]
MKSVLITIGDEILSGNTVDTNSNFIAAQLKSIGIPVVQIFTISDEVEIIKKTLASAFELADLVITTGGLGPTRDDRTKTAFAEFFDDKLTLDDETFEHLKKLMIKRKREHLLEINKNQAVTLFSATVFQNENGTAPCQMIEKEGKTAICLPGVPYEVKPLIKDKIIPHLKEKLNSNYIVSRFISVVDFPESLLAKTIENWELGLPETVSLSYLPVGNRVKLRLTASGNDPEEIENLLNVESEKLRPLIGEKVISWDGSDIQEIMKEILKDKKMTLSVAESCTGGELSRLITSVSGSSAYFLGGVIPYDYHKKIEILGVSEKTVREKTVVSEEVAQEMSLGCQKLFGSDISLSTTGVAGPNSDEFNTEVGVVFYSVRVKDAEKTVRLFLPHLERNDFVNFVSQRVLQDLVQILVNDF